MMVSSKKLQLASLMVLIAAGTALAGTDQHIYWTAEGSIARAFPNGSNVEPVKIAGVTDPKNIALDVLKNKIYCTDATAHAIVRANLDGSSPETVLTGVTVGQLALDPVGGKVYWTEPDPPKVRRANLDGSNIEDLVTAGPPLLTGIALDVRAGRMYWANHYTRKIFRANLDGSDLQEILVAPQRPVSLAVDTSAGNIYWTSTDPWLERGWIHRASTQGGAIQELFYVNKVIESPYGIALDSASGKMYWAQWASPNGRIRSANLDGSGVIDLVSGLGQPASIALDWIMPSSLAPAVSLVGVILAALAVFVIGGLVAHRRVQMLTTFHQLKSFLPLSLMAFSSAAIASDSILPRAPIQKPPSIHRPSPQSKLMVKFRDQQKARESSGSVTFASADDTGAIEAVVAEYGLTFRQAIRLPVDRIRFLQSEATRRSGIAQPDLAGIMSVRGTEETLEAAARALLTLDEVEWVQFVQSENVTPCVDFSPPTGDYFSMRGPAPSVVRNYHGSNPGLNVSCAWSLGARGGGLQVADCEYGYTREHEDLCDVHEPLGQVFHPTNNVDH